MSTTPCAPGHGTAQRARARRHLHPPGPTPRAPVHDTQQRAQVCGQPLRCRTPSTVPRRPGLLHQQLLRLDARVRPPLRPPGNAAGGAGGAGGAAGAEAARAARDVGPCTQRLARAWCAQVLVLMLARAPYAQRARSGRLLCVCASAHALRARVMQADACWAHMRTMHARPSGVWFWTL